jgi:hypothetical protein
VTDGAVAEALTRIDRARLLFPKAFVALNVAVSVVAVAGVPVIAPVEAFKDNGLMLPEVIDHVIGAEPVAARVCE